MQGVHLVTILSPLFCFSLDDRTLALPLGMVIRAIMSVEVTPLPATPEIVAGVISFHGEIIPVVDIRVRFGVPRKEIVVSDRFILIRTSERTLAIIASCVIGVLKLTDAITPAEEILPGARYVCGVLPSEDRLILIHDSDAFLSLDEETAIDAALTSADAGGLL